MKILRLSASNVMRLRAVEIEPAGTVQIVAGKNGAGKSSVLNALWLALGGGAASREIAQPVRHGEESAEVTVDLGEPDNVQLVVTRTWDEDGKTALTVRAGDGARYKSPQTLLDQLIGKLSFDPLAFTRLSAREQREALLDLLGLDFTAEDAERARLYDLRLDTGRQADAYGDLPKLAKNAPTVEKSAGAIVNRITTATEARREIERKRDLADEIGRHLEGIDRRVANLEAELVKLRDERAELVTRRTDAVKAASALPAGEDIDALRAELAQVEEFNQAARENRRIASSRALQQALQEQYTEYTRDIAAIDRAKAKAIAAAEMPVAGLGFDDSGVTFGGVPFSQASSAEQVRVSFAMACALNPTLRVVRIMDGSLLDSDSLGMIRQAAEAADMQVFIEMVGADSDDPAAVVISDGEVISRG